VYDLVSLVIGSVFLFIAACIQIPFILKSNKKNPTAESFLAASILASILSAFFIFSLGGQHILMALALGIGITCSILNPVCAACFFIGVLFLRPWEALPQNLVLSYLPRGMAVLTVLSWLGHSLFNKSAKIVWNLPCSFFAAFILWLFISSFFSTSFDVSMPFFLENFIPIVVLFFLILNSFSKIEDLDLFVSTVALSVLGIIAAAAYVTLRDYSYDGSLFRLHSSGLWGNSNDLAALIVCAMPLGLGPLISPEKKLNKKQSPQKTKILTFLYLCILLSAVLWTQSRGALIAVSLGAITYFLLYMRSFKATTITAVVVVLAVLCSELLPTREEQDVETSNSARANYLIAGIRMAKDHPLFGVGMNKYSDLYEHYTPAFFEWGRRTAHSTWVLILAEEGIIGLLLFVALCLSVTIYAWRMRRRYPQFFLALITYGTAMSFLSHSYLFLPYILMAFLIVASRNSKIVLPVFLLFVLNANLPVYAEDIQKLEVCPGGEKPIGTKLPELFQTLTLSGSRGEVLIYLIRAEGKGCHEITYSSGENGGGLKSKFYDLPPVNTENPSFPGAYVGKYLDPAVPLSGPVCFKDENYHWLLGEVNIPQATVPGTYSGKVNFGGKTVDIKLKVWKMSVPIKPSLPGYSEMTPWFSLLGHHGKWSEDEAELAQAYIAAMSEHRIYPLKSFVAPLEIKTAGQPLLEISEKPSPKSSFKSITLNRPSWAYFDFPTIGSSGFEKIDFEKAKIYFTAVENTLKEIGRPDKAIVYLWDEPKPEAMPDLLKLSKLVDTVAPSLKQLVTITFDSTLANTVDIFAPVMDQFDNPDYPSPKAYQEFKRKDPKHEVWWYVSCMSHGCEALRDSGMPDMVIDRPASYIRSISWLSMKYQIDSFLYYSVNNGYQYYPKRDPWKSLWDFSGNGDGTLFYPGRAGERGLERETPIASLRLKLWRESSYDADYIKWMNSLKDKPEWWNKEFNTLVKNTTEWSKVYSDYRKLRDKAGEYLDSLKGVI
jgi:O-antigen ligase